MLNTQRLSLLAWDNLGVGIIMHGKGIYLLIGQTCTPHSLDFRQDVGNTLVYALVLFAETLRKEFIV